MGLLVNSVKNTAKLVIATLAAIVITISALSAFALVPITNNSETSQTMTQTTFPTVTPTQSTHPNSLPTPSPTASPTTKSTPAPTESPTPTPTSVPIPTQTEATTVNGSLELTFSIPKTVYSLGEQVDATYVLTNIGNQTTEFSTSSSSYYLQVYNSKWTVVYDGRYGVHPVMPTYFYNVSSGGNMTLSDIWHLDNNLNLFSNPPVSAGIYYIVSTVEMGIGDPTQPNYHTVLLQTPPLEIVIQ